MKNLSGRNVGIFKDSYLDDNAFFASNVFKLKLPIK